MASVTGYWGGQNIELNNAATEQTQQQIKQLLSSIDVGIRSGRGSGPGGTGHEGLTGAFTGLAAASDKQKTAMGKFGEALGGVTKVGIVALGSAINVLNNALYSTARGIGQFDGGLADLGQGVRGITDELGGLGALVQSSIGQYQRQFQAFGQMSQMGAGAAVKLDDLQNTAADLGVSLPQYTQMIQQFAGSFTYGGANISKSIALFNKSMVDGITTNKANKDLLRSYGIALGDQVGYVMKLGAAYNNMNEIIGLSGDKLHNFLDLTATRLGTLAQITGKSTEALLAEQAAARKDNAVTFNEQVLKGIYGDEFQSMYDAYYALTGDTKSALKEMTAKALGAQTSVEQVLNMAGMGNMASKLYGARGPEQQAIINQIKEGIKSALANDPSFRMQSTQRAYAGDTQFSNILGTIIAQGNADKSQLTAAQSTQLTEYGKIEDAMYGLSTQTSRINQGMMKFGITLLKATVIGELYIKSMQEKLQGYVSKDLKIEDAINQMTEGVEGKIGELIKEYQKNNHIAPSPALNNGVPPVGSSSTLVNGGNTGNVTAANLSTGQAASAQELYAYMISKGLSPDKAMGILANMKRESGFNPAALVKDSNGFMSGGLIQWNGERYDKMTAAVPDWKTNPKAQIDYLLKENHRGVRNFLGSNYGNARDAAHDFYIQAEQPYFKDPKNRNQMYKDQWSTTESNLLALQGRIQPSASASTTGTGTVVVTPPAPPQAQPIVTGPVIGSSAGSTTVQETQDQKLEREKKEADAAKNNPAVVAARNTADGMTAMVNKLGELVEYADDQLQELQAIRKHTAEAPDYRQSARVL